ncbi:NADH-quinone oxidoreductase subunit L [bacterium]|nr:NADH-quinone oxidoreductase subunit L [bacterium]
MFGYAWMMIAFPLIGAAINGFFGKKINNKKISGWLGTAMLAGSFATALAVYFQYMSAGLQGAERFVEVPGWTWIAIQGMSERYLHIDFALLIDPLSVTMMLFITGISMLIHMYSTEYMSHDEGLPRFFTYLNLFVAMMLILILGANIPMMFVGWEGVGLCSYLLIGFWYRNMENAKCGMKAFITNRVGDFGILIGLFMIFQQFDAYFRMHGMTEASALDFKDILLNANAVLSVMSPADALFIALFLFLGACGKSAQFPLHIWLPDAMAGPTPVSALIHAATMVTSGVYMVTRLNPVFSANETSGFIVACIGAGTAFMAATIALTQNDIKKVLAYSTVSQLGYMFLACGVGAYWVAIFHVITHAFFKACLFLGSGSVIHGMHEEQDTRHMGGLAKYMPITYWTFVISTFAIAGIFPLAGFFSKDEILWQVAIWDSQFKGAASFLYWLALFTALMTAFYMGRVTWKTFLGKPRWTAEFKKKHHHPHESHLPMTIPLMVLATMAVISGAILFTPGWMTGGEPREPLAHFLDVSAGGPEGLMLYAGGTGAMDAQIHGEHAEPAHAEDASHGADDAHGEGHAAHHEPFMLLGGSVTSTEMIMAFGSVLIALIMLILSNRRYTGDYDPKKKAAQKAFGPLYAFSYNKWYIDEIYNNILVRPGVWLSSKAWQIFDVRLIDGIVNGVAKVLGALGELIRPVQTGFVRNYMLYLLAGAVMFMLINMWSYLLGGAS